VSPYITPTKQKAPKPSAPSRNPFQSVKRKAPAMPTTAAIHRTFQTVSTFQNLHPQPRTLQGGF
jgi:hypothetical protein